MQVKSAQGDIGKNKIQAEAGNEHDDATDDGSGDNDGAGHDGG